MAADDVSRTRGQPGRGPEAPRLPAGRRLARKLAIGFALAAYSWAAASTAAFSAGALLVVLLPGAVIAVIAVWRPGARIPPPGRMDVAGFSYWADLRRRPLRMGSSRFQGQFILVAPGADRPGQSADSSPSAEKRRNLDLAAGRMGAGEAVRPRW